MPAKKNYKYLLFLMLGFVLALTACNPTPTPQPTIYNPGCDVPNLINNLNSINQNQEPAVINLDPGCIYTLTQVDNTINAGPITIHNGLPLITKTITINGNNATIDIQGPAMGHFYIQPSGDLELYDLTLSNGSRPVGGAVINLQGDFFASRTTFLNNVAYPDGDLVGRGGAVYNDSGRVRIIDNSHFQENHAGELLTTSLNLGGAIFNVNGALVVTDSSFHQNFAAGQGGAIYSMKDASDEAGEFITINEAEFLENYAFDNGGALMLVDESSTVFIVRSEFRDNRADNSGGAMFAVRSNVEGTKNEFWRNSAIYGGAVYTKRPGEGDDSKYLSEQSNFIQNTASEIGGAIFSESTDITMDKGLFMLNTANSCGAFSNGGDPSIDIIAGDLFTVPRIMSSTQLTETHFYDNEALQSHGGAVCHVMGELSFQDSYLQQNRAVSMGGALLLLDTNQLSNMNINYNTTDERGGGIAIGHPWVSTGFMAITEIIRPHINTIITGSSFIGNETTSWGGAIYSNPLPGSVSISSSTFSGNEARHGGGIYSRYGHMYITNSTFSGNSAFDGGGFINYPLRLSSPDIEITHSTFAYNVATQEEEMFENTNWGGGAVNLADKASIENSLFVDNLPMDCQLENGMNYSGTENYSTDGTCGGTVEPNPMIGPLLDNGGGTGTHALLPGSPLIDVLSGCAGLTDDQRGIPRPKGSACDPGAYEFDPSDPPIPPPMPETSDCDPFAGMEVSLLTLGLPEDTMQLPVVLRVDGEIPGLNPEAMNGSPLYEYNAQLGDYQAYKCGLQGYPDRLYCMFQMLPGSPGLALNFQLTLEGCDDPVYVQPLVSIPEPVVSCRADMNKVNCEAAGGTYSESRDTSASTCICP